MLATDAMPQAQAHRRRDIRFDLSTLKPPKHHHAYTCTYRQPSCTMSGLPSLQLPTLTPLEPLTKGTNLPEVPDSELAPPPPPPPQPSGPESQPELNVDTNGANKSESAAPPQSPGKPASVKKFLSRVSLNNDSHDDKASVFSAPTSVVGPDGKRKKNSWWKRVKRSSQIPPGAAEKLANGAAAQPEAQSGPPPPRLPDNMFGKDLAAMDADMFENLK